MAYKFGGNEVVHSYKCAQIPIQVGKQQCMLETEVVDIDLPLLISKQAMKTSGMILNFHDDTAELNGENIVLDTSSSGHYILSLTRQRNQLVSSENLNEDANQQQATFMSFETKGMTEQEKNKVAIKLHRQFGHPTHERLAQLVKTAGSQDGRFVEIMQDVATACETCQKYSKKNPRPVVGMSLSKEFNGTIAMDLKQVQGKLILHIIDLSTRYSQATIVDNKRKETIVEAIIKCWISIFGVPDRILSDNGGEFNNRDLQDMAENLNTEVTTTAAEAPWSNGICERHNAVIGHMVDKMIDDSNCSLEIALAWSINAKNSLHNVYGFSPSQLVFGRNPNLPATLNDNLPALGGMTQSEQVAKHLNAKHDARKAFVECEASEKIRRALRRNVRESTTIVFQPGDRVYYKRQDSDIWKGPAVVIGKDTHQIILKHGGLFVRVHPVSLRKVNEDVGDIRILADRDGEMKRSEIPGPTRVPVEGDRSVDVDPSEETGMLNGYDETDNEEANNSDDMDNLMTFNEGIIPDEQNVSLPIDDDHGNEHLMNTNDIQERDFNHQNINVTSTPDKNQEVNTRKVPKARLHIQFRDEGTHDPWQEGVVINRAGKAKRRHKMWMHVQTNSLCTTNSLCNNKIPL